MSFLEQTAKLFGDSAEFGFQIIAFGRNALFIEGAKPVRLDPDQMIFRAPRTLVTVTGESLAVKELSGDCAAIVGAYSAVTVTDL